MASSFSWSRNRFYNTTYKHAFTYKDLWGRSLFFSQVFPLSDQILIFLGHCLPDLRHRHWVFSAKGSWPQPNTSRHSIRNSLPMSTHIYCFSHKTFMCLIWNLCYCFYQSSGEVVGDGGGGVCVDKEQNKISRIINLRGRQCRHREDFPVLHGQKVEYFPWLP